MDIRKTLLYTMGALLFFVSCDKYFEDDISDEELVMISPADGVVTHETKITFWWEELDEATKYELQVVSPSFDSAIRLVVDTLTTETIYEYEFTPNTYECRVRAENSGSSTEYVYRSFKIDSSMFLNNRSVELLYPLNNAYLQVESLEFTWSPLQNTDSYAFSLKEEGTSGANVVDPFNTVTTAFDLSTKYSGAIPEGEYVWRVQAENSISASIAMESKFFVDRTAPDLPTLVAPALFDSVELDNSNIELTWQQGDDNFEVAYDSVFIYSSNDSVGTKTTLVKRGKSVDESFKTGNLSSRQWYLWTVVSVDKAGNATDETQAARTFYLKD